MPRSAPTSLALRPGRLASRACGTLRPFLDCWTRGRSSHDELKPASTAHPARPHRLLLLRLLQLNKSARPAAGTVPAAPGVAVGGQVGQSAVKIGAEHAAEATVIEPTKEAMMTRPWPSEMPDTLTADVCASPGRATGWARQAGHFRTEESLAPTARSLCRTLWLPGPRGRSTAQWVCVRL